ncbi:MAG: hypothetical protein FWF51_02255 [Chitinivibrionia bacterium]|nr:hypothetical protein [Chitinivibrionia bacterium]
MSINGIAFWSSDYAYEIMGTKRISRPSFDVYKETGEIFESEEKEEFAGFKPRVDEYIPLFGKREIPDDEKIKLLGEKDKDTENVKFAENAENPQNPQKTKEEEKDKNAQKTEQFSEEEKKVIDELKSRDMEVRNHEQAHISAGGAYIRGGASYTFQSGPDGKQYAIGGEVSIDTSPVKGNPEATIAKMQTVISAAMAPANPSGTDRAVAAAATQMQAAAMSEVLTKNGTENTETVENTEINEQKVEQKTEQKTEENTDFSANNNTEISQNNGQNISENNNFSAKKNTEQKTNENNDFSANGESRKSANNIDKAIKAQNNIISAISAYTAGAGIQNLASKIDFAA